MNQNAISNEALVVATNRPDHLITFLGKWKEEIDFGNVSLIVMHDTDAVEESRDLYRDIEDLLGEDALYQVFNHAIVEDELKDNAWIIPRHTSACKSYGIWKAWEQGAERIFILDDDCYPDASHWIGTHRIQLGRKVENHVLPTITHVRPRGIPYLDKQPIMLSHGVWNGIPDVDAVTQLNGYTKYTPVIGAVPRGALFPMCGMNIAFNREIVPLMYFGLQGPEWGVDRHDDIWCGFIAKRIMDHLGMAVWTGTPPINHTRLSDPFVNLEKEQPGYKMNCEFYEFVMNAQVIGGNVNTCMNYMGAKMTAWDNLNRRFGSYFEKYGQAMMEWASLFKEK